MGDAEKHIHFVDVAEHKLSKRDRNESKSLSGSSINLYSARCRRIVAVFALPQLEIQPALIRRTPAFLEHLLSDDFEEFVVEKLGTRRLFVNLGPFSLPNDDEDRWDTRSSVTTFSSASGRSGESMNNPGEPDDLYCVPNGFLRDTEEHTDEHVRKNHIEIAVGKGGMFTRSTYRYKEWSVIRNTDLLKADLVVLCFSVNDVDESQVTLEEPSLCVSWSIKNGLQPSPAGSHLSSHLILLLEALFLGKNLLIYNDSQRDSLSPFYEQLLAYLTQCSLVKVCSSIEEFTNTLQAYETFAAASFEEPGELIEFQVNSNEDILEWTRHFVEFYNSQ